MNLLPTQTVIVLMLVNVLFTVFQILLRHKVSLRDAILQTLDLRQRKGEDEMAFSSSSRGLTRSYEE